MFPFGRPPNWITIPNDDGDDDRMRLITLRELTMLGFMNQLTDKPGWEQKVRAASYHNFHLAEPPAVT